MKFPLTLWHFCARNAQSVKTYILIKKQTETPNNHVNLCYCSMTFTALTSTSFFCVLSEGNKNRPSHKTSSLIKLPRHESVQGFPWSLVRVAQIIHAVCHLSLQRDRNNRFGRKPRQLLTKQNLLILLFYSTSFFHCVLWLPNHHIFTTSVQRFTL